MQVSEFNDAQLAYMVRLLGLGMQEDLGGTARDAISKTASDPSVFYTPANVNRQVNLYQKQANDMLNTKLADIGTSYATRGEFFSGGHQLARGEAADDVQSQLEKLQYGLVNQNRQGLFNAYTSAYGQQQNAIGADVNQLLAPMMQSQDVMISQSQPGSLLQGIGGLVGTAGSMVGNFQNQGRLA